MNSIKYIVTLGAVLLALVACESKKPTAEDHLLSGQQEAMEKAKQVESLMQDRAGNLEKQMEDQQR